MTGDNHTFAGPPDGAGYPGSEDPIARNPKDVDRPEDAVQPAQVHRRGGGAGPMLPGQAGGHARSPLGSSPKDMLLSILRFKWTLLAVFLLTAGPMVALIWTQVVPKYKARATIRIRPIIPRLVFKTDENGTIPFYDSFVNTQISVIGGQTVLGRVLDQDEVQQTLWYQESLPDPKEASSQADPNEGSSQGDAKDAASPAWHERILGAAQAWYDRILGPVKRIRQDRRPHIERLREALSVRPRPRTEIIDVSFTDARAEDAKTIVDAVLAQYMIHVHESGSEAQDNLYDKLLAQYRSLESEIKLIEGRCTELHRELGTEEPQDLISTKRVRLDMMDDHLRSVQNQIKLLESQKQRLVPEDPNAVDSNDVGIRYHVDEEWRRLTIEAKRIDHQIENSRLGPNHPDLERLRKDLKFTQELVKEREDQLDELWRDRIATASAASAVAGGTQGLTYEQELYAIEKELDSARQQEDMLKKALEEEEEEFKSLFETAQLLQTEANVLRHKRELFEEVRRRLDQKNVERNVPGSISVLAWAFSPSSPAQDRRMVFTAMALFVAFGLGGGAAFLRASRNQSIYAPRDMPQPMQVPFLGHIPNVGKSKAIGEAWCEEIARNQHLTESVRVMRTGLLSRLNGHKGVTVLVSSAMPGTGKSSFTMILGRSLAQTGKKVLIVDADFHKMTLSSWFELADRSGFMDALGARTVETRQLFATKTGGLHIMPAGRRNGVENAPVVVEEIANGAFKRCMDHLVRQYNYDIILLDGPPMLPVADAVILASQVEGTIMVERENLSQRGNVTNALMRLNSTGGRLLGTVFVEAGRGGGGSYKSYGGYGGYAYTYSRASSKAIAVADKPPSDDAQPQAGD